MITRGTKIALTIGILAGLAGTAVRVGLQKLAESADRAEAAWAARAEQTGPNLTVRDAEGSER